ncbi:MAG: hypothetical protein R3D78_09895 [Paracoccaceae bacterium]
MSTSPLPSAPTATGKRRLVVHLGFPKTATTTIQAMLAANAGRFGPGIVVSPKDELTRKLRKNALRYMRSGGKFWFKWRHGVAMREMVRKIDAMDFETLLISDENMVGIESGKIFDPPGGVDFTAWVRQLDAALSGYDVTYVLYTRDPAPWRVSAYNQAFKMRRVTEPFADWVVKHDDLGGPARIVEELRGFLGDRLKTLEMADEIGPGKLMGRYLLELAGVSEERIAGIVVPPRKNESLPPAAIEFLKCARANPRLRGARYRDLVRLCARHPDQFSKEFHA